MLNTIVYFVVFALVIYAFAVLITPIKHQPFDEDENKYEVTDADFPKCEAGSDCACKNK